MIRGALAGLWAGCFDAGRFNGLFGAIGLYNQLLHFRIILKNLSRNGYGVLYPSQSPFAKVQLAHVSVRPVYECSPMSMHLFEIVCYVRNLAKH